ncbi:DUF4097 family beta strand repeat-containing protein [Halobacterium yunchengense]|uniref:DUF4097 family beta strand repeat-containing protein n=1 Tax=Halobacterium yunchengense TaxID=3108497 RepID=UPI00300A4330
MRRRALLSTAATGAAALAGCLSAFEDAVSESREYEFDLPDGARFRTAIDDGDVDVSTHGGDRVLVDAVVSVPNESRLGDVTVEAVREDDLLVDVRVDGAERRVSVDLDVRLPAGTEVAVARSWNGDVSVRDVAAAHGVGSANGDVVVRDAGPVARAETTNGDVTADVPALVDGEAVVRTENGDADAALSATVDAALSARTQNGDVSVSGLELADREASRTRVSGVLGDGAGEVTVASVNGDVTVTALE